jgi:hypothetical protein
MDPLKANDVVKDVLGWTDAVDAAEAAAAIVQKRADARRADANARRAADAAKQVPTRSGDQSPQEAQARADADADAAAEQATAAKQDAKAAVDEATPEALAVAEAQWRKPQPEEEYGGNREVFIGFLGGLVTLPSDDTWVVLYLDLALTTWLLVQPRSIVNHRAVEDRATPGLKWNMLWVKADASVGHGSGPVEEAQFLVGGFVRAASFPNRLAGGTFDGGVGVFRVAGSPNCCTRRSN